MEVDLCSECGLPKETTPYVLCWVCWKDMKQWKRNASDTKYILLQEIIDDLLEEGCGSSPPKSSEIKALKGKIESQNQRIRNLETQVSTLQLQLKIAQGAPKSESSSLDQSFIRKLLTFCHPDRNADRAEKAHEITKVLLQLRKKT